MQVSFPACHTDQWKTWTTLVLFQEVFQQLQRLLIKSNNVQQRVSSLWVKHNILGSKINTVGRFKKCVSHKICKRRAKLIIQFSFTTIQTHNWSKQGQEAALHQQFSDIWTLQQARFIFKVAYAFLKERLRWKIAKMPFQRDSGEVKLNDWTSVQLQMNQSPPKSPWL